ncbi:MAG TPA: hypothetical protein VFH73_02005 [Polyangia bacterium]|nr:hypothetical protein [Polyangia bacterium]
MVGAPKAKPPAMSPRDRTSAAVSAGIVVLFVLGVVTVFGEPLVAVLSPPAASSSAPTQPPPSAAAAAAGAEGAARPATSFGRGDGGGNS